MRRKEKGISVFFIVVFAVLVLYALSMLLLLFWGVNTSLKTQNDFRKNVLGLPSGAPWNWAWDNYVYILRYFYVPVKREIDGITTPVNVGILEQVFNTLMYAGIGSLIATLVPCIVSYMAAKFDFRFGKILVGTVIVTLVIPIIGSQPSEIQLLRSLSLYDSFLGAWVLKFNFLGMYFLVFYGTFRGVSKEYAEAAYIDGASELTVMLRVMIPLVKVTLMTVICIKFIEFWNDYQVPLLYLPSHPTLAYGVFSLSTSSIQGMNTVPMRMVACVIVVIPVLVLFVVFRDRLMGNVSMGGIKE